MPINPATMNLIASAAGNLLTALPKTQLARFGLTRAVPAALVPFPLVGAVAGGALVTALAIPQSRRWMFDRAASIYSKARRALPLEAPAEEKDASSASSDESRQTASDADGESRQTAVSGAVN